MPSRPRMTGWPQRSREWLTTSVAPSPSWRWALLAAAVIGVCALAVPPDPDMGRRPDADVWSNPSPQYGDFALFVRAGRALLMHGPGAAYADPTVQTGPLALLWAAALAGVLHVVRGSGTLGSVVTACVILAPAFYACTLWGSRLRPARWLYVAAVGALVVLLVPWQVPTLLAYQHPTYTWVPALWLWAVSTARRERPTFTAVLLVVACALETWAVLAVPVVLLVLPTWRTRVQAGAVWLAGTVVVWAPFATSDEFRMLDMTWQGSPSNILVMLWGDPASVSWAIRATQGAVVVAVGTIAWFVGRSVTDSATVAVAVVAWTRVVTDVQWFPYYRLSLFLTTAAVVLAAAAEYLRTRQRRALAALGSGAALLSVAQAEALGMPPVARIVFEAALLVGLVVTARAVPPTLAEVAPSVCSATPPACH